MVDSSFEFKIVGDENARSFVEMIERWKAATEDNNKLLKESIELQKKLTQEINITTRARRSAPREAPIQSGPTWTTQDRGPTSERDPKTGRYRSYSGQSWRWSEPKDFGPTGQFKSEWQKPQKPDKEFEKIVRKQEESFKQFHQDTNTFADVISSLGRSLLKMYAISRVMGGGSEKGANTIDRLIFGSIAFGGGNKGGGILGALLGQSGANRLIGTLAARGGAAGIAGGVAGVTGAGGVGPAGGGFLATATQFAGLVAKIAGPIAIAAEIIKGVAKLGEAAGKEYFDVAQGVTDKGRFARGVGRSTGEVAWTKAELARFNINGEQALTGANYAKYDARSDAFRGYSILGVDPTKAGPNDLAKAWQKYSKGIPDLALFGVAQSIGVFDQLGGAAGITTLREGKAGPVPTFPGQQAVAKLGTDEQTINTFETSTTKMAELSATFSTDTARFVATWAPTVDGTIKDLQGLADGAAHAETEINNFANAIGRLLGDKPAVVPGQANPIPWKEIGKTFLPQAPTAEDVAKSATPGEATPIPWKDMAKKFFPGYPGWGQDPNVPSPDAENKSLEQITGGKWAIPPPDVGAAKSAWTGVHGIGNYNPYDPYGTGEVATGGIVGGGGGVGWSGTGAPPLIRARGTSRVRGGGIGGGAGITIGGKAVGGAGVIASDRRAGGITVGGRRSGSVEADVGVSKDGFPTLAAIVSDARTRAIAHGVDPDFATGIILGESGLHKPGDVRRNWGNYDPSKRGQPGTSYGQFQLRKPGLGTEFERTHPGMGLNATTWQQQNEFAISQIAQKGPKWTRGTWMSIGDAEKRGTDVTSMGKNWMKQYGRTLSSSNINIGATDKPGLPTSSKINIGSTGISGTSLGVGSSNFPAPELDPEGKVPSQFIMHHTAGRGSPADIVKDWSTHRPGVGAQFIMDREGVVHDVKKEFGYSGTGGIVPGYGPLGKGVLNRNSVQMEIIAKNDADVTDLQAAQAAKFIAADYPKTPVLGHGQVNPGHRETTEGQKARLAVEALREQAGSNRTARAFDQPHRPVSHAPEKTSSLLPHIGDMSQFQGQDKRQAIHIFNRSGSNVNAQSAMLGLGAGSFMS